jgi:hypothetical protein
MRQNLGAGSETVDFRGFTLSHMVGGCPYGFYGLWFSWFGMENHGVDARQSPSYVLANKILPKPCA